MVEIAFAQNFWGDRNHGFDLLMQNFKASHKASCELSDFFRECINIHEQYQKSMHRLAQKVLNLSSNSSNLCGSFTPCWHNIKMLLDRVGLAQDSLHKKWLHLHKDVQQYSDELTQRHKDFQRGEVPTQEALNFFQRDCQELQKKQNSYYEKLAELSKIRPSSASGNLGFPASTSLSNSKSVSPANVKEIEKCEQRFKTAQNDYRYIIDRYNNSRQSFIDKMMNTAAHFQEMEQKHLEMMLEFLEKFSNSWKSNIEENDKSLKEFSDSLHENNAIFLLRNFVKEKGTGQNPPPKMVFDDTKPYNSRILLSPVDLSFTPNDELNLNPNVPYSMPSKSFFSSTLSQSDSIRRAITPTSIENRSLFRIRKKNNDQDYTTVNNSSESGRLSQTFKEKPVDEEGYSFQPSTNEIHTEIFSTYKDSSSDGEDGDSKDGEDLIGYSNSGTLKVVIKPLDVVENHNTSQLIDFTVPKPNEIIPNFTLAGRVAKGRSTPQSLGLSSTSGSRRPSSTEQNVSFPVNFNDFDDPFSPRRNSTADNSWSFQSDLNKPSSHNFIDTFVPDVPILPPRPRGKSIDIQSGSSEPPSVPPPPLPSFLPNLHFNQISNGSVLGPVIEEREESNINTTNFNSVDFVDLSLSQTSQTPPPPPPPPPPHPPSPPPPLLSEDDKQNILYKNPSNFEVKSKMETLEIAENESLKISATNVDNVLDVGHFAPSGENGCCEIIQIVMKVTEYLNAKFSGNSGEITGCSISGDLSLVFLGSTVHSVSEMLASGKHDSVLAPMEFVLDDPNSQLHSHTWDSRFFIECRQNKVEQMHFVIDVSCLEKWMKRKANLSCNSGDSAKSLLTASYSVDLLKYQTRQSFELISQYCPVKVKVDWITLDNDLLSNSDYISSLKMNLRIDVILDFTSDLQLICDLPVSADLLSAVLSKNCILHLDGSHLGVIKDDCLEWKIPQEELRSGKSIDLVAVISISKSATNSSKDLLDYSNGLVAKILKLKFTFQNKHSTNFNVILNSPGYCLSTIRRSIVSGSYSVEPL